MQVYQCGWSPVVASCFAIAPPLILEVDFLEFLSQLDGRVKTLHPNIHGGILARRDQKHHMEALNKHGIG